MDMFTINRISDLICSRDEEMQDLGIELAESLLDTDYGDLFNPFFSLKEKKIDFIKHELCSLAMHIGIKEGLEWEKRQ